MMTSVELRRNEDGPAVKEQACTSLVERVFSFLDEYARAQSNTADALRLGRPAPLLFPQK